MGLKGQTRDLDVIDASVRLKWDYPLEVKQVRKLDEDMFKALEKMEKIEETYKTLPHIDCGSCGAPTCRAFAEDIIRGEANVEDCIFMLREKVRRMATDMLALSEKLPPSIDGE